MEAVWFFFSPSFPLFSPSLPLIPLSPLPLPPFPHSVSFPSLPLPLPYLPFIPYLFPSLPLEVGPLNPARGSTERWKHCMLPSGVWAGTLAEIGFGAFYP